MSKYYTFAELLKEARACNTATTDTLPGYRYSFRLLFLSGWQKGVGLGFLKGLERGLKAVSDTRYQSFKPGTPGFLFWNARLVCVACPWSGLRKEATVVPNNARECMDDFCPDCGLKSLVVEP